MWEKRLILVMLGCLSLLLACGGDETPTEVDAGDPRGDGAVSRVSGILVERGGADPAAGVVKFRFMVGEEDVSEKVWVELSSGGQDIAEGAGSQALEVVPGSYNARITYRESSHIPEAKGVLSGLSLHAGATSSYKVGLEVAIGRLQMDFTQLDSSGEKVSIADQVQLAVYRAGADHEKAVWEGLATSVVALSAGDYDVKVSLPGREGNAIVEWHRGIRLAGGMALTEKEVALESDDSGVRIDVFNFSSDVNSSTNIAYFRPDSDLRRAVAVYTCGGGQLLPVEPGTYDVLLRYAPSSEVQSDKLIEDLVVPSEGGVRLQVDLEQEMAILRLSVFDGEEDVSERVNMLVKRAGADAVAGFSVLDIVGVGEHYIAAGTYDIYLEYNPATGERMRVQMPDVTVPNGAVWEQRFEAQASRWSPAPAKLPSEELRPIDWAPPAPPPPVSAGDDDDSSGDDDDSSGDDDDSAPGRAASGDVATSAPAPTTEEASATSGDDDDSAPGVSAGNPATETAPPTPEVGERSPVPDHERSQAPAQPPSEGP